MTKKCSIFVVELESERLARDSNVSCCGHRSSYHRFREQIMSVTAHRSACADWGTRCASGLRGGPLARRATFFDAQSACSQAPPRASANTLFFLVPKARRAQKLIFLLKKYYGLKQFFKLRIFRFPKRNVVESRISSNGLCLQRQGQCTTVVKKGIFCEERSQCGQKPKSH